MADIFISYSRNDRIIVEMLASELQSLGYTVWWDTSLLTGDSFSKKIEEEINCAKCAIVVWSKSSIKSKWVIAEANLAMLNNILLPISIENKNISLPLPFNQYHTSSLYKWTKNKSPFSEELLNAIELLTKIKRTPSNKAEKKQKNIKNKSYLIILFLSLIIPFGIYKNINIDKIKEGTSHSDTEGNKHLLTKPAESTNKFTSYVQTQSPVEADKKRVIESYNNTMSLYHKGHVNLDKVKFDDWDYVIDEKTGQEYEKKFKCKNPSYYLSVNKGFILLSYYYYLIRSHYSSGEFSNIEYPQESNISLDIAKITRNFSLREIVSLFSKTSSTSKYSTSFIKKSHKENIFNFTKELISYKEKFDNVITDELMLEIASMPHISNYRLYKLGFPANTDECFSGNLYFNNIKTGNKDTHSDYTLDTFLYSFWYRRYNEGNHEKIYSIIKLINKKFSE